MSKIAVYIHWPYCLKKCPYCDFNSHVSQYVDHEEWRKLYGSEIKYYNNLLGKRTVTSVFFGGGTPSLMEPKTINSVLNRLSEFWTLDESCEITLEANPTSIETQKFANFKSAGVNRVSVGVQSLRDDQLNFLGREHSAKDALSALAIANKLFDRVSFDLIYARPGQTIENWKNELTQALEYASGQHMSLYQLTIEDGTQFKTLRDSGRLTELNYDIAGDMYLMTQEMMADAGLPSYEISNYAAKGEESRHNLTYWRYQDYVGIGPGAHGRVTLPSDKKIATRTHKAPEIWMKNVLKNGHGAKPFDELLVQDQRDEKIMMGLRLEEGISKDILPIEGLSMLFDNGFLRKNRDRVFVPKDKWPVLDSILAKILVNLV